MGLWSLCAFWLYAVPFGCLPCLLVVCRAFWSVMLIFDHGVCVCLCAFTCRR